MLKQQNIQLVVFDMAGTVVDEGGVVYDTLARILKEEGESISQEEFDQWHGANKVEVIRHFLGGGKAGEEAVQKVYARFQKELDEAYFTPGSGLAPMAGALACFDRLRGAGIKVALDTGYPRKLADRLIAATGFGPHIDGSMTSEEAGAGRPYPYMIHALMKQFRLMETRRVAKVGDTVRDMEEGVNAGCGLVVGVLSGADKEASLKNAGAHLILPSVAHLEV